MGRIFVDAAHSVFPSTASLSLDSQDGERRTPQIADGVGDANQQQAADSLSSPCTMSRGRLGNLGLRHTDEYVLQDTPP